MPLTKANLKAITGLLVALAQRQQAVFDLAQRLTTGQAWVGPDGQLAVNLAADQKLEMETFIDDYLAESEIVITTIRSLLADKT